MAFLIPIHVGQLQMNEKCMGEKNPSVVLPLQALHLILFLIIISIHILAHGFGLQTEMMAYPIMFLLVF